MGHLAKKKNIIIIANKDDDWRGTIVGFLKKKAAKKYALRECKSGKELLEELTLSPGRVSLVVIGESVGRENSREIYEMIRETYGNLPVFVDADNKELKPQGDDQELYLYTKGAELETLGEHMDVALNTWEQRNRPNRGWGRRGR